jgi:hypothetical protein
LKISPIDSQLKWVKNVKFAGDKRMIIMNVVEKRDFIHSHLHRIKEPVINEMYDRMVSLYNELLIEESEDDIKNGNLIPHTRLKQEIQNWRLTK